MVDGILNFPDTTYLIKVLVSLDLEIQVANNLFRDQYSNLGEEAFNNMFDSLGLNEQQPLVNFENELSFTSLRSIISAEHDAWLETDGENDELNPNRHFIVDNTVRAILNKYGEVKIGDIYYTLTEEGYNETSDLQTLVVERGRKISNSNKLSNDCKSNERSNGTEPVSSTKKFSWVVSHWTLPWGKYATAKLDNYKKKGRRWVKYKSVSIAQVYGDISDIGGNCDNKINFNTANGAYVSADDEEVKHKISVFSNTKRDWIYGYWKVGDKEKTKALSW
mgnify:CR=1 FL=1